MDDATQGLNELLSWSTDFNSSAYNLAGSLAAALLGVALIFVIWALAMKKENAKSHLIAWLESKATAAKSDTSLRNMKASFDILMKNSLHRSVRCKDSII